MFVLIIGIVLGILIGSGWMWFYWCKYETRDNFKCGIEEGLDRLDRFFSKLEK